MRRVTNRESGFTFLEVLISMALVGILSVSIFPLIASMIILPNLSIANMELANLRASATHFYNTNNVTASSIEDLRPAVPVITGNYTVDNGSVVGLAYPGLKWGGTHWILKRGG